VSVCVAAAALLVTDKPSVHPRTRPGQLFDASRSRRETSVSRHGSSNRFVLTSALNFGRGNNIKKWTSDWEIESEGFGPRMRLSGQGCLGQGHKGPISKSSKLIRSDFVASVAA
jgi:hypothetical protein